MEMGQRARCARTESARLSLSLSVSLSLSLSLALSLASGLGSKLAETQPLHDQLMLRHKE